jgi:sigma-B regulation protein RsbU (phosphoserine phosphatase)
MGEPSRESRRSHWSQVLLGVVAIAFAGTTILYSFLWMSAVRSTPAVELAFQHSPSLVVTSVVPGKPADVAGIRPGDRIAAVGRTVVADPGALYREYRRYVPGDRITITVERPNHSGLIVLPAVFQQRSSVPDPRDLAQYFAGEIRNLYPIPFLVVGLTVLLFRLRDPHAWLLACIFAGFIASPSIPAGFLSTPPFVKPVADYYQAIFVGALGASFYAFFAVFPVQSPVDCKVPWLKWLGAPLAIVFGLGGLEKGGLRTPTAIRRFFGEGLSDQLPLFYVFGFVALGLVSLAASYRYSADPEVRRKLRVILWGTAIGVPPSAASGAAAAFAGLRPPWWLDTIVVSLVSVFPLSFAYAVVKHRVLDIPILLKRSARYVLVQKGFLLVLALMSIALTVACGTSLEHYVQTWLVLPEPAFFAVGALFGTALFAGGLQIHKHVGARIDKAFFREAYDARLILSDLAERTRTATDQRELALLLRTNIDQALHPEFVLVYLKRSDGSLAATEVDGKDCPGTLSKDSPALVQLAQAAYAMESPAFRNETSPWIQCQAECLTPMLDRKGSLTGLLALGRRLSEEPYSGEDRRLLTAVASQAAAALDNMNLAEEIARKNEAQQRAEHEMEIAKSVQARLLPQCPPQIESLECAARCLQAKSVGGDYYDFLRLGPDHLGLILADVAGKGVHAALLMATLQAHLRDQSSLSPLDPVQSLRRVNRMLWECTASHHYATLFYGVFDCCSRELVYVNCGHNPPLFFHSEGSVERLEATGTVIGLFENWECSSRTVQLAPEDLLIVFSDGVTEATRQEEEFGEERLIEEVRAQDGVPADGIVNAIFRRVLEFSEGAQADDLTVLVARARPGVSRLGLPSVACRA